jgi:hypothetical protein
MSTKAMKGGDRPKGKEILGVKPLKNYRCGIYINVFM